MFNTAKQSLRRLVAEPVGRWIDGVTTRAQRWAGQLEEPRERDTAYVQDQEARQVQQVEGTRPVGAVTEPRASRPAHDPQTRDTGPRVGLRGSEHSVDESATDDYDGALSNGDYDGALSNGDYFEGEESPSASGLRPTRDTLGEAMAREALVAATGGSPDDDPADVPGRHR